MEIALNTATIRMPVRGTKLFQIDPIQLRKGDVFMRSLFKQIALISFIFISFQTVAETQKFEIYYPSVNHTTLYPGLDLNQLNKVKLNATKNEFAPELEINRLELQFENASNLIASSFTNEAGVYRAIVNSAWVYKQVVVEVNASAGINPNENISIAVYVVEHASNLNNTGMSYGMQTLQVDGSLTDVTPNPLADSHWLKIQDKGMTLRLYQRPVFDLMTGQQGFKIKTSWLGHGEREIFLNAPFTPNEFGNYKAVALKVDTQTLPDGLEIHSVSVDYEDLGGAIQSTPFEDLQMYLDQVYPPAN